MFRNIDLMQKGLDAAWMRQDVIAHNIANVDTPDYNAQHVEFESLLKAALNGEGTMEGYRTHEKHIRIGGSPDPMQVKPITMTDYHYEIRMDGNNVDPDHQMTEMAANYIRYSALQARVTGSFNRLKMAIREGK
jgi:flagellar basal-body rod protein FlgB